MKDTLRLGFSTISLGLFKESGMAKKTKIPDSIIQQVIDIVGDFNRSTFGDEDVRYVPRIKGDFVYLDRHTYGRMEQICRLKFTGNIDNWDFAIFKYSSERYDPNEWMFPGSDEIDGTLIGAMKAGLYAYPT